MQASGLDGTSFAPDPNRHCFFAFDALEQRLNLFHGLIKSRDELILVLGEKGSGKTTFLEQFRLTSRLAWKKCRYRTGFVGDDELPEAPHSRFCPAIILQDKSHRTVIFDDAHLIEPPALELLLKKLKGIATSGKVDRMILFGEPTINAHLMNCHAALCDNLAISRIYLPVLTEAETVEYLRHRLSIARVSNSRLLSRRVAKKIHRSTGGLPGRINSEAEIWLQKNAKKTSYFSPGDKPSRVDRLRRLLSDVTSAGERLVAVTRLQPYRSENSRKNREKTLHRNDVIDPATVAEHVPAMVDRLNKNIKLPISPPSPKHLPPDQTGTVQDNIHREEWLLCQDPECFTIQVLGVRSEAALAAIVKTYKSLSDRQIACCQTLYKGERAYPLLWGIYRTRLEASAAIEELPDKLKEYFPLIRPISAVHQYIHLNGSE